jgi:hypothetical protein
MAKRLPHTTSTKEIARLIGKRDRRELRQMLRTAPDSVLNFGPRGRAIWESH